MQGLEPGSAKGGRDAVERDRARLPTALSGWVALAGLLVFPVVLKVIKGIRVSEGALDLADFATVVASDGAFALVSGAALLALARLFGPGGGPRWIFWALSIPYLLVVLELSAIEHEAWLRSSSLLDWTMLWYTIRHFDDLSIVIAAETTVEGVALLVGAGLLAFLPAAADVLGTRIVRRGLRSTWRAPATCLALAVPFAVLGFRTPSAPELEPLAPSASVGLLAGAWSAVDRAQAAPRELALPDADRARARIDSMLDAAGLRRVEAPGRPRNVLLLVLESTRFDVTDAYVPGLGTTPELRKLANTGVRVDRAYVDVPHTSKALVSILCGYSPRLSVQVDETGPGGLPTPCLPHVLGELGYHNGFFQAARGNYENRHQFALNAGFHDIYTRESYDETGFEQTNYLALEDKVVLEPMLRWVREQGAKPFLLTLLTCISHHSYGLPSTFEARAFPRRPSRMGGRMPRPWVEYERYLNTVRYADELLGDILHGLKRSKVLDDTLVVVVGDHGQAFHEHGQKAHNTVIWEEALRVPLVFHHPGSFPQPRVIQGLRRQVDIAPTVLATLGVSYPETFFEGRDLMTAPDHAQAYSTCWYDRRCAAETRGQLRAIDHFDNQPMEVYDLASDPFERHDLLRSREREERERWTRYAAEARTRMREHAGRVEARYRPEEHAGVASVQVSKTAPTPTYRVPARLEGELELLGYDTPSHEVVPGGFWEAVVHFKCLRPSPVGWRLFGTLASTDGREEREDHHPGAGRFYLHQCEPGTYVSDRIRLWIPTDFPAGTADYWWGSVLLNDVGSFRRDNPRIAQRRVAPLQRGLVVRDREILLARLEVKARYSPVLAQLLERSILKEAPAVEQPLDVRFGDGLVLLDAKMEPKQASRYGSVQLTTVWRVDEAQRGPWKLYAHIVHRENEQYNFQRQHTPVDGLHPVGHWEPGTWIVDSYALPMHDRMPPGPADVWIGFRYDRKRVDVTDAGRAVTDDKRVLVGTLDVLP